MVNMANKTSSTSLIIEQIVNHELELEWPTGSVSIEWRVPSQIPTELSQRGITKQILDQEIDKLNKIALESMTNEKYEPENAFQQTAYNIIIKIPRYSCKWLSLIIFVMAGLMVLCINQKWKPFDAILGYLFGILLVLSIIHLIAKHHVAEWESEYYEKKYRLLLKQIQNGPICALNYKYKKHGIIWCDVQKMHKFRAKPNTNYVYIPYINIMIKPTSIKFVNSNATNQQDSSSIVNVQPSTDPTKNPFRGFLVMFTSEA